MDVHVPSAITNGLRLRGVDVLTSQEDGTRERSDPALLDCATALHRLLFTRDEDLLREAAQRQERGETFAGVVYAHQLRVSIGQCVQDLVVIALAGEPEDFVNRVEYLPLRSGTLRWVAPH
jgi:predicted nuclease of predicted toxin-antitoxin system